MTNDHEQKNANQSSHKMQDAMLWAVLSVKDHFMFDLVYWDTVFLSRPEGGGKGHRLGLRLGLGTLLVSDLRLASGFDCKHS